jgi:transcriptional regulator with XRE-family HTH domain
VHTQAAENPAPTIRAVMARKPRSASEKKKDAALGQRLARLRNERGFTQVELAEKLGVAQPIVSDYERGRLRPHPDMLTRLAAALQISADELLGLEQTKKPAPLNRRAFRPSTSFPSATRKRSCAPLMRSWPHEKQAEPHGSLVRHRRSASPPESLGAAGSHNAALCDPPSGARALLTRRNDDDLTADDRKPRACPSLNITSVLCFLRRAGSAPLDGRCNTATSARGGSHRVARDDNVPLFTTLAGDTVLGCATSTPERRRAHLDMVSHNMRFSFVIPGDPGLHIRNLGRLGKRRFIHAYVTVLDDVLPLLQPQTDFLERCAHSCLFVRPGRKNGHVEAHRANPVVQRVSKPRPSYKDLPRMRAHGLALSSSSTHSRYMKHTRSQYSEPVPNVQAKFSGKIRTPTPASPGGSSGFLSYTSAARPSSATT